jgi:5-methylcytosine-specific restriction endonuclease McrA
MFDFPSKSIEEAKVFAKTIMSLVKEIPDYLLPIYTASNLTVKRKVKKEPGTPKSRKLITVGSCKRDWILSLMDQKNAPVSFEFDGVSYNASLMNYRLRCFKKNPICSVCDLEGTEFRLERQWNHNPGKGHWNLYGQNQNGHWVLMTVDHIIPRSKGGPDHPDNFQTMCERCNQAKRDDHLTNDQLRIKLKLPPRAPKLTPLTVSELEENSDFMGMDVAT